MVKTFGFAILLACLAALATTASADASVAATTSMEHGDSRNLRGAVASEEAAAANYPHIHVASMEARMKARANNHASVNDWDDEDFEWAEPEYESAMEAARKTKGKKKGKKTKKTKKSLMEALTGQGI